MGQLELANADNNAKTRLPAGSSVNCELSTSSVSALGFEPRTNGLKGHCSAVELRAHENGRNFTMAGVESQRIGPLLVHTTSLPPLKPAPRFPQHTRMRPQVFRRRSIRDLAARRAEIARSAHFQAVQHRFFDRLLIPVAHHGNRVEVTHQSGLVAKYLTSFLKIHHPIHVNEISSRFKHFRQDAGGVAADVKVPAPLFHALHQRCVFRKAVQTGGTWRVTQSMPPHRPTQ
jgi:hypothetical protein